MTKSFLLTALACFVATGAAAAQTPPRPLTPTSTPPAPLQRVAFKQVLPAAEAPAKQNIRIQVRLITLPVGNVVVKELFEGGRESDMPKPVILSKDGLHAFREKLAGERQAVVLQAPRMNHFDRQPIDFRCGDDVSFDTAGGKVKVFVGTACKLTPTIGEEGKTVKLAVDLTSTERNGGPPTDVRNFKSLSVKREFAIPVGGTAAMKLGTRKVTTRYEFGPPVLSQIPYLNRLFKNVGIGEVESDVVAVFTVEEITPLGDEEIIPVAKLTPAAPKMFTKVFSVGDLVCPPTDSPLAAPGADSTLTLAAELYTAKRGEQLQTMVRELVKPYSWEEKGGAGRLDYYATGYALVVNGEQKVVEEVGELLASLERCQAGKPGGYWEHLRANSGSGVMRTPEPTPKHDPHVLVQMTLFSVTGDRPEMRKLLDGKTPPTGDEVKATIAALKKAGVLDVQSRPQLMLTDRQTGFFQLGQQFPRLNGVVKGVQQVEYIPVGLVVRATPAVSECAKTIRMRLEVSQTTPSDSLIDLGNGQKARPIDTQAIESDLTLPSGGTRVVPLGRQRTQRIESKIPVLGDLPYVGRLFRTAAVLPPVTDNYAVVTVTRVTSRAQALMLGTRMVPLAHKPSDDEQRALTYGLMLGTRMVPLAHREPDAPAALPIAPQPMPAQKPKGSFSLQFGWSAKSGPTASVTVKPAPPVASPEERMEQMLNQSFTSEVYEIPRPNPTSKPLERIQGGIGPDPLPVARPTPLLHAAVGGGCGSCRDTPVSLMKAYKAACAAGKKDEAARLALQLLANDPTCFGRGE